MLIDKSRQIVETNASIYLEEARDTTKLSNCWAKYSIYLRGNKIKKPEKATKPLKRRLEKFHAGISLFLRNISVSGNRKREWQSQKLHFPIILFFQDCLKQSMIIIIWKIHECIRGEKLNRLIFSYNLF